MALKFPFFRFVDGAQAALLAKKAREYITDPASFEEKKSK